MPTDVIQQSNALFSFILGGINQFVVTLFMPYNVMSSDIIQQQNALFSFILGDINQLVTTIPRMP